MTPRTKEDCDCKWMPGRNKSQYQICEHPLYEGTAFGPCPYTSDGGRKLPKRKRRNCWRVPWDLACIARFTLETGGRRGEVLGLRYVDLDLTRRTATFVHAKNGHPRTIPLTSLAVAQVTGLRPVDPYVFTLGEQPGPVNANPLEYAFRKVTGRASS